MTPVVRKTLLYESKVEYGGWTINHVQGCSHGCRYPCYAMMLAKRTGRVKTYEDWCRPQVVENALELLGAELPRLASRLDSVHLSFTTDPFMYDAESEQPNSAVVALTTKIIERLNDAGVRVTTLTKGVYPDAFIDRAGTLDPRNQYGISLVSLSEDFRSEWEPGSAPADERIASLERAAEAGFATWVSAEPYPTPNVDPTACEIGELLESVSFADKIVFGRWHYSKLVNSYEGADEHYERCASQVADWCTQHGKMLHIKAGTPLSERYQADILAG